MDGQDEETMEVAEDVGIEDSATPDVTSRKVNVKSGGGKVMAVVREQYLRSDLSCQSSLCFEASCQTKKRTPADDDGERKMLPSNVTHYLVPFVDVAGHYMDILELEELSGIIFFQTVVNAVKFAQGGLYRRLVRMVEDPKKATVFFANEFFKATALQRLDGEESMTQWQGQFLP